MRPCEEPTPGGLSTSRRLGKVLVSVLIFVPITVLIGYGGGVILTLAAQVGYNPTTTDGSLLRTRLLAWPGRNRAVLRTNGKAELPIKELRMITSLSTYVDYHHNDMENHSQSIGKRIRNRLVAAVLITVALWVWLELIGLVIGHSASDPLVLADFPVVRDVIVQLLRGLFAIGATLAVVRAFDISNPSEWMGIRQPDRWEWGYVPLGLVLAFVWLLGALILIQNVLGLERTTVTTLSEGVRYSRLVTLLLLVGPAEEVIFHGVIQRSLEEVVDLWQAILIGGLLFGVAHLDPAAMGSGDLLFYAAQGGFGVIVGWIYARTNNLVIPALVHGLFVAITTALPLLFG